MADNAGQLIACFGLLLCPTLQTAGQGRPTFQEACARATAAGIENKVRVPPPPLVFPFKCALFTLQMGNLVHNEAFLCCQTICSKKLINIIKNLTKTNSYPIVLVYVLIWQNNQETSLFLERRLARTLLLFTTMSLILVPKLLFSVYFTRTPCCITRTRYWPCRRHPSIMSIIYRRTAKTTYVLISSYHLAFGNSNEPFFCQRER